MKPKIFIASPLFNPPQIAIIERIEGLLQENGYDFYSARLHSGSDRMAPEQRKDINAWDPVFNSNEQGLDECRVMVAVLEYAMPKGQSLRLCKERKVYSDGDRGVLLKVKQDALSQLELPDAGTVWECGYHRAQGKIVLGFHTDQAKHLNLMLSHGCDALIRGWENLEGFLANYAVKIPFKVMKRSNKVHTTNNFFVNDASHFDWSYTESWDAANKEVE